MAVTLKLVCGADSVDFWRDITYPLNYNPNIRVRYDGWIPATAVQNEDGVWEEVDEVMTLRVDAHRQDSLSTALQSIDRMMRKANEYKNRSFSEVDPVWLYHKLRDETNERRALILRGKTEPMTAFLSAPTTPFNTVTNKFTYVIPQHKLGVTRMPFWEGTSTEEGYDATYGWDDNLQMSTIGGTAAYAKTRGDAPGRINEFYFAPAEFTATPDSPFYEAWAGFRSNRWGNLNSSYFRPNWDLGDSDVTIDSDNVTRTAVSSAYNGYVARYNGNDSAFESRAIAHLHYVVGGLNIHRAQVGTFVVLLRARVTSGGDRTFNVRLGSGYYDKPVSGATDTEWRYGSRVRVPASGVSAGDFYYYPLGMISIPPDLANVTSSLLRYFSLNVDAERNSGSTGSLDLDTLTLIPTTEGFIHIKKAFVDTDIKCSITTSPDDKMACYSVNTGSGFGVHTKGVQFDALNWGVPPEEYGRVVVAAQEETQQDKNKNIKIYFDYYPRWVTMRGDD